MTAQLLASLPLLVPMTGLVLCLVFWRWVALQRGVMVGVALSLSATAVALLLRTTGGEVLAVRLGDWPAPMAITLVVDQTAAIMVLLTAVVAVACTLFSLGGIDRTREHSAYYALLCGLFAAVCGAFTTNDLFNLYVWFEVMLMSSFVLLSLGGRRAQIEGAIKYVTLNLISSTLFLAAIGLTYAMLGTLNMADMAERLAAAENPGQFTPVAAIFLVAFAIKSASFPFFYWLPASYHTPPSVISAVFAGLLTKVGIYVMIRFFGLMFPASHPDAGMIYHIILWLGGFSMVTGVLSAAAQMEIRRILSVHIISQIGYMLMGLGIAGSALHRAANDGDPGGVLAGAAALALAGTIFHIAHNMVVKVNLFLVAGTVERICGSGDLNRIGGLYAARPGLAALFLIPALSLAGIPVLSGFWSKFLLVRAGLVAEAYVIIGVSLFVSVLTLFSMIKIWIYAFWKPAPENAEPHNPDRDPTVGPMRWQYAGSLFLTCVTILIGVFANQAIRAARIGADQLIEPRAYLDAAMDRAGEPASADPASAGEGVAR
ncbi:MAG: Na+/H+ antiporter subunit D [Phycisphaerales bacterium]|nr:Na+/H+ antiporter subunit D [Planctomycetota bacterium]MCH8508013.1 Na+/H+ antiporter subunit D [Phycisphaerales bacterium]